MKAMKKALLCSVLAMIAAIVATAQCSFPTPTITGTLCAGSTLSASPVIGIQNLKWYLNGNLVQTSVANYTANGTVAGGNGYGTAANQLNNPSGVFVDDTGNVYICDLSNNRIQKWAPGATSGITVAGGSYGAYPYQLNAPSGVFVDGSGNIYIADRGNNRVQKWAAGTSNVITVAGGNGSGSASNQLNNPVGVFVDSIGNVYVCDAFNHRIQKWAPGATSGTTVAGGNGSGANSNQLYYPYGVFVDVSGNIYVSDQQNQRIQKWAPGATSGTTVAGGNGSGSAMNQLSYPTGVYVDASGYVYISDYNNNRIQRWGAGTTSGVTVAGNGTGANQLWQPMGISFDNFGNLYVSDANNHRIQKWMVGTPLNTLTNSVGGTYTVNASNFKGCNASSSPVDVTPVPVITANGPTNICSNGSTVLTLTSSAATGNFWNTGDTTTSINVTTSGNYSVTVTSYNGCLFTTAATTVNVNPLPTNPTITGNPCSGATLTATPITGIQSLQWSLNGSVVNTITNNNNSTTIAGGNGVGSATYQLNGPTSVYKDGAGNIYITDYYNHRVQKWLPGASSGTTVAGGNGAGANANQLWYPFSVVVDSSGNLYISDQQNQRIQKWAPGATSGTTVAGGNGVGSASNQLSYPAGIFVDASGNIYISDNGNHRIQKWAPGAASGTTVAGGNGAGSAANQFNTPTCVNLDNSGNLYVADHNNHRVQKWVLGATSGTTVAGGNGAGSSSNQLNNPFGVVVDGGGNVYISDLSNNRIQKWASGAISGITVAGGNGAGNAGNQLNQPMGIYFDATGRLYISDNGNHRVQLQYLPLVNWIDNAQAGTYTVTATTIAGCSATSPSFVVNQSPAVTITPSGITTLCTGDTVTLTSNAASNNLWSTGDTTTSITVTTSGSYSVSVTNSNGCSTTSSIIPISVAPLSATPTISGNLCSGSTLTANPVLGIQSLQWRLNGTPFLTNNSNSTLISTVAGGNGGGSAANQLYYPFGVFVDGSGNTYISDQSNHRIQKWAPGATSGVTVAGGSGTGSAANHFNFPTGLYVDASGNIYVSDNGNNRIQKWTTGATSGVTVAGSSVGIGGSSANQLNSPTSVYLDNSGNMYISDHSNHRIQKWAPGASSGVTIAGGYGAGSASNQLNNPMSVFVDGSGNLYVSDQSNHRIQKWTPGATIGITVAGGNGLGSAANQLNFPAGIYVDGIGNIYVSDNGNNRVQKWTPGATSGITIAGNSNGTGGSSASQLNGPTSVYVDISGNVYVSDQTNHRIQKYTIPLDNLLNNAQSGTYTVTATNFAGCSVTSTPVVVNPSPSATITANGPTSFCVGNSVTLTSSSGNSNVWNTGDTTSSITVLTSGSYSVTVTNASGCSKTSAITPVAVAPAPSIPTITGNLCNSSTIFATPVTDIQTLQWNLNGAPFYTSTASSNNASVIAIAGGNGAGSAANQLWYPYGISVDGSGNLYVSDQTNQRVQKWAPGATNGSTVAGGNGAGSTANQLNYPAGIFVSSNGTIYICDNGNNRVQKWTSGASSGVTVAGGNGSGAAANQLNSPIGIYVDASGNVYVTDANNNRVQKWAPNATTGITVAGGYGSGTAANQLSQPTGVYVDGVGNVYVSDAFNNRIQKWAPNASSGITIAGGNGNGSASNQLSYPVSINFDLLGNLYIVDQSNNRVQKWVPGATSGTTVDGGIGAGSSANQLDNPTGIVVDANGNMYICDQSNHRVLKINNPLINWLSNAQNGTYTVTATSFAGCSTTSLPVTFNNTLPTVNAGADQTVCAGSSVTLTGSGAVNYTWNNGIINNQAFTASTTNAYVVTGTDSSGCSNKDTVIVNVNPLPIINAGLDVNVCVGASTTLNAASNGTIAWNNNVVNNQSFTPTVSGNYIATATSNFGCIKKDTLVLSILPLPNVNAGLDKNICIGSSTSLTAFGAATYAWTNGITNGLPFVVNATNTYVVTGTSANGCVKNDTVVVNALALPSISAGPDKIVCNGSATTLTATGGQSYSWSGGIVNGQSFVPVSTATYIVSGTGTNTCVAKDTIVVNVVPIPNVNAGADQTACFNTAITLTATGATSLVWSGGVVNGQPFTVSSSQFYSVIGTDSNGCTNSDIVHVVVNPIPTINAGADVSVCQGNSIYLHATSNSPLSWNNNITNNIPFVPQNSGIYIATAINSYGCIKQDTAILTVYPLPNVFAGNDQSLCPGVNTTLSGSGALVYSWTNGVTNGVSFLPAATSPYVLTGLDSNGCSNKDTMIITLLPVPAMNVPNYKAICPGGNTTITAIGADSYLWSNGDTTASSTFTQQGYYSVIGVNNNGCSDTVNLQVQIKAIPVSKVSASTPSACQGETIDLSLMTGTNATGFDLQWYNNGTPINGATDAQYSVTNNGNYQLSISGGTNCSSISSLKNITFKIKSPALFSVVGNTVLCQGEKVSFNAQLPTSYTYYKWLKDNLPIIGSPKLKVYDSGSYSLVVCKNGCVDTSLPVNIAVLLRPTPSITTSSATICSGDSTKLMASPQPANYTYKWLLELNQIINATDSFFYANAGGNYKVIVSNAGCEGVSPKFKITINSTPSPIITPLGSTTIAANGSVKLSASYVAGAAYQWYLNGNLIMGASSRYFMAYLGGNYTVSITKNSCTGLSPVLVVTQTNVREELITINDSEQKFELIAYPNPVSDVLTINISGLDDVDGTLSVMDMNGKLLAFKDIIQPTLNIEMNDFPSGIYFIRFKDKEGRTGTLKITKQ